MPPARPRTRILNNENDENATASTRLTRAKAAALTVPNENADIKKPLATKKTNATISTATAGVKKRAALGDVSNVGKADGTEGKATKKPLAAKAGSLSKAAQPTGIVKPSRANSTKSVLGSKDRNSAAPELKRSASGSGIGGHATKKRNMSSTSTRSVIKEEEPMEESENMEPVKQTVSVEIEKTVKVTATVEPKVEALPEAPMPAANEVMDLDQEDLDDPLMVAEYVNDIFEYYKTLEKQTMANPDYMESQEELEWKMRGILVDWLLEVHTKFHLLPETLFLCVNIIDRFLSTKVVQLDRLQLVGVTALFIASKYEEVLSPHVENFRRVADDGFEVSEILQAERYILAALDYDLSYPNPMNFLRRISKADEYDVHTRTLGKYLLEIGCLDYRFLEYPPSLIAAAAMYFARLVLEKGEWDATLAHYAGYTEPEIQPCFLLMVDYLSGPVQHDAFFRKYASKKFMKASIVLRSWGKKYGSHYLGTSEKAESQSCDTPQL